jgi:hypothetical protein
MFGLKAVSAHNGWAMAAAGAIIVMCGLSVLAFVISQLHKVVGLFEERKKGPLPVEPPPADIDILSDLTAAALRYQPLTDELGDSFPLAELYRIFETEDLPHPHLTITALREAEYLLPAGEGLFCWKKN